eukprot:GHVU01058333.1.p1 GENE.GHVU01058333.1~~GHVU01058333.1.p1  ORF type:complete len:156 (-),score=10.95 GHVU01058333.1:1046-1513(-)
MDACILVRSHAYKHTRMHTVTHTHTHTHAHTHTHTHARTHARTHAHTHPHAHTRTSTHPHKHTYKEVHRRTYAYDGCVHSVHQPEAHNPNEEMCYWALHVPYYDWRRLKGAKECDDYMKGKLKEDPSEWLDDRCTLRPSCIIMISCLGLQVALLW